MPKSGKNSHFFVGRWDAAKISAKIKKLPVGHKGGGEGYGGCMGGARYSEQFCCFRPV